jgi:hypothetical protein
VAVCAGHDVGGTCVNRGCVPSKALLAASGRVRAMGDADHLDALGVKVDGVSYDRAKVAAHANNLASRVKGNLENSLTALGVTVFPEKGALVKGGGKVELVGAGKTVSAKDIMLATGSVPFVPPGVQMDGKTVFTSDEAHLEIAIHIVSRRVLLMTAGTLLIGAQARVGARLHRHHRLGLHRPRVLRRVTLGGRSAGVSSAKSAKSAKCGSASWTLPAGVLAGPRLLSARGARRAGLLTARPLCSSQVPP